MNTTELALKHLQELGAFEKANPIIAKAIAMHRLIQSGVSDCDAEQAITQAFRRAQEGTGE